MNCRPLQGASKPSGYRQSIVWQGLVFRQDGAFRFVFVPLLRLGQHEGFFGADDALEVFHFLRFGSSWSV